MDDQAFDEEDNDSILNDEINAIMNKLSEDDKIEFGEEYAKELVEITEGFKII